MGGLGRDPFGQAAQDAGRGLDEGDREVELLTLGQAGRQFVMPLDQFGGQFDPGGAGPDDGDVHRLPVGIGGRQEGGGQPFVERLGVRHVFQQMGVFGGAGRAEQVRAAADGQDEGAELHRAGANQDGVVLIPDFAQGQGLVRRIEAGQIAEGEAEMIAPRQHRVGQAFLVAVQRPRSDLVQAGLPQVEDGVIDQQDATAALARAEPTAQAGGELKPARAAADNDDVMFHSGLQRATRGSDQAGFSSSRLSR